jgi:transcriptional regulator with XRE-family HTH domain
MDSPGILIREARLAAGLSQRSLAERARTSQPAIARYEQGAATPSLATLERLLEACGKRLRIRADVVADAADVELAERLLELTPLQRLRALPRYARLRNRVVEAR